MLARVVKEQVLKVRRAGRKDHAVSLDGVSVSCQRDIDERLILQQLVKDAGQIRLVIVPTQAQVRRR